MQPQNEINVTFSARLTDLINYSPHKQKEISARTGISESGIANYKKGRIPKGEELHKLAQFFNVTMEWLLTGEESQFGNTLHEDVAPYDVSPKHDVSPKVYGGGHASDETIPVLSWVHAGDAMAYDEMPEGYLETLPVPEKHRGKKMYGLIVAGDSMEPEIHNRDRVGILVDEDPWSGCYCVAKFKDDKGVQIRRFQRLDQENVKLIPYNTIYEATKHHMAEFDFIKPVAFVMRDTGNPNQHLNE